MPKHELRSFQWQLGKRNPVFRVRQRGILIFLDQISDLRYLLHASFLAYINTFTRNLKREFARLRTLNTLGPYLWQHKWRVLLALSCLISAKLTNVAVPIVFKDMIDKLTNTQLPLALPILMLVLYGALRFSNSLFTELREILFARVTQQAVRRIALEVFRHLHALSLRFHLERQTGGVSRDIERGSRSISSLISYTLYSILPTLVEISLVLGILFVKYDIGFRDYADFTVSIRGFYR